MAYCRECNYITGHAESCTEGLSERTDDMESRLLAKIEALEERVAQLEELEKVRETAAQQTGRRVR
jgi:hypothetical protein